MASFAPEIAIYDIDRVIAAATPGGCSTHPGLTLTLIRSDGREFELPLHFKFGDERYLQDIALAINDAGSDHGRLTNKEETVLREEDRLSPRPTALRHAAE